jgi:RNA-directed DNA polymerase
MMKEQSFGASSNKVLDWKAIEWPKVRCAVRRLQLRIAKAIRAGKHGKAKALSWLLTHSRSAKLLAVKRVTENKGAKTPGVDNQLWRTDRQKYAAVQNLKRRGYRPLPLRRHYIPKKNGKLRPLSIPTLRDRAMQALHALALKPIAETVADRNSYGFREGRSCADAIGQCFCALAKSYAPVWVLEGDIKSCFDRISHKWLLANIPMDARMLRLWLAAGYWEKGRLFPTREGTPQGGIVTPRTQWITSSF